MFARVMRQLVFGTRAARNAVLDARYGKPVIGSELTRFEADGATDMVNSDWGALGKVFGGRIRPDDVLVDLGCGRGRVLNYWLSSHPDNRIVGVEIDPGLAGRTAARLQRWPQVEIIYGSAVDKVPTDASVLFLFNPFERWVLEALIERLEGDEYRDDLRLFYYNPKFVDVFDGRPGWSVESVDLGGGRWAPYSKLAIIERSGPAS